jgi:SH3-like domain-containing protein
MKRARVLLWLVGAVMCVVSILLFTHVIDVFNRADQPKRITESEAPTFPPIQEASRLASVEIAPQQADLDVLDPPAQSSRHAIAPDLEPPVAYPSPATESKNPATADAIEEVPSPTAPNDEFVTISSTVSIRNGPSASAVIIGRAYAGARARVASRDSGWLQIVDSASGNTGWVNSSVLAPSPTTETAATEESSDEAPDEALDTAPGAQSSQTSKNADSATKSKPAAKAKHLRANRYYDRRRFAFSFRFRGFLR